MHCPDVEWSRDNTIRPLASVSVTLSRVRVSDRAHLPQCLNVHFRFFFKTFFCCKKTFLFKLSNRAHLPHCFFPLPPPHFQALSAFVFSSSNVPTTPASSSLMEKKIIQRAYFSQKKTSPIFNFSPNKFADFDFQIDENFSFQRPASQQNCLYVSCDDSK